MEIGDKFEFKCDNFGVNFKCNSDNTIISYVMRCGLKANYCEILQTL